MADLLEVTLVDGIVHQLCELVSFFLVGDQSVSAANDHQQMARPYQSNVHAPGAYNQVGGGELS